MRTRLSLSGSLVVARDIAHAKIQERLDAGLELPDYIRNHIVYYGSFRNLKRLEGPGSFLH